jgi:hypothetical protein
MRKYRLFSEWRGVAVIGEDLGQAVKRAGLKKPDAYREGRKVADGDEIKIKNIIRCEDAPPYNRGGQKVLRTIVEDTERRIHEVDAVVEETFPAPY